MWTKTGLHRFFRPGRASHTHQREHHRFSGFRRWRESLGLLPGLDSRRSHPLHSRVEQGLLSHLLRLQQGQVSRRKICQKNICSQLRFLTNPNVFLKKPQLEFLKTQLRFLTPYYGFLNTPVGFLKTPRFPS